MSMVTTAWRWPVRYLFWFFSIGFGKALYRWRSKHPRAGQNTEFVISALPLGGYVQMLDSREATVPRDQLSLAFDQRSL